MKIIFISNYMSHHQLFLSEELNKQTSGGYTFVATEPISEERIKLGWSKIAPSYLEELSENNREVLLNKIMDADAVIIGSASYNLVKKRIKCGKLTFTYGERPYKIKPSPFTLLVHWIRFSRQYHYPNVYRLCASAFSPVDYARTNTYIGKSFRWGYFTEVKEYTDIDALYEKKNPNSILWCGRMIDWKHPEIPIIIARKLKESGIVFKMVIIGTGILSDYIARLIKSNDLTSEVSLHDSMSPEQVREYMEKSSIYLFTSDRQEGWGAVLNEAMNSACAVVANSEIGAVPFLISDKKNGYIYEDGNIDQAFEHVKSLLKNDVERHDISINAYKTMVESWNPKLAATRLIELINSLMFNSNVNIYNEGPCSLAPMIRDDWYKYIE